MPIRLELIEVMREAGLELSGHKSKSIAEMNEKSFGVAVTVCDAAEACPLFHARRANDSLFYPGSRRATPW